MSPKASDSLKAEVISLLRLGLSIRKVSDIMKLRGVPVPKSTIFDWKKKAEEDKENVKSLNKECQKRGPKPAISKRALRSLENLVMTENQPSQRILAAKFNVHRRSIQRYIKKYLGLEARVKPKVHGLTTKAMAIRHERAGPLAKFLQRNKKLIITSDEKLFHISEFGQKSKYYYRKQAETSRVIKRIRDSRFGKSLMVWAAVSWNGKSDLYFVRPGVKINSEYYINSILEPFIEKDAKKLYPDGNFVFHQDSAPSHASKLTLEYLRSKNIRFIEPKKWTPNSPDNAPMDYFIWGHLMNLIKQYNPKTIAGMKKALSLAWDKLPLDLIRKALCKWPKRCYEIYRVEGAQIEHLKL